MKICVASPNGNALIGLPSKAVTTKHPRANRYTTTSQLFDHTIRTYQSAIRPDYTQQPVVNTTGQYETTSQQYDRTIRNAPATTKGRRKCPEEGILYQPGVEVRWHHADAAVCSANCLKCLAEQNTTVTPGSYPPKPEHCKCDLIPQIFLIEIRGDRKFLR
jgi:hypothetical protein